MIFIGIVRVLSYSCTILSAYIDMVTVTSSPSSPASYSSLPSSSTTTLPTSASCMTSDWPAQDKGCGGQSWAGKGRPASVYGSSWKRARGEVQPAVQGAGEERRVRLVARRQGWAGTEPFCV